MVVMGGWSLSKVGVVFSLPTSGSHDQIRPLPPPWTPCVLVAQLCLMLCDSVDCSLPGSVRGVFQARISEWVTVSFSRGSS